MPNEPVIRLRDLYFGQGMPMTIKLDGDEGTISFRVSRTVLEKILSQTIVGHEVHVSVEGDFLYLGEQE